MNVRAHFLDMIRLFFVWESVYTKQQTIVIDVELLKQADIIFNLLD